MSGTINTEANVSAFFARYSRLYRVIRPRYQMVLLEALAAVWPARPARVLDVGTGNGLIADYVRRYFAIEFLCGVDIENRLLTAVSIDFRVYDGQILPFENNAFDCILLTNVLHHVPRNQRQKLLVEIARVCAPDGIVILKDHAARNRLDTLLLALLDLLGNVPFAGMLQASYFSPDEWTQFFAQLPFDVSITPQQDYRAGWMAFVFPNHLEVMYLLKKRAVVPSP